MNAERIEAQYEAFCMTCMQPKGFVPICPFCHTDETRIEPHPLYLKSRTLLHQRYLIGNVLAQGGFGITYVGFDIQLHRKVAIKEYFPTMLATRDTSRATIMPSKGDRGEFFQQGLQFFIAEARTLAKFERHPNIVNVHDFFEANSTGYMVMQFLEGCTLAHFINHQGGKLPIDTAKQLMSPILDALKAIHAVQLYHRDISPQNIMIIEQMTPVLIDFGAARYIVGEQSRSMDVVMKPGYTPIEQLSSRGKIGPWTDVYACGATFYFMITGVVPPSATDRLYKDDVVQPADIPDLQKQKISKHFNDAILRSLAVREDDRFRTVEEFEQALQHGGFKKTKPQKSAIIPPKPTPADARKNPLIFALIGLIVVALVVGMFFAAPDLYRKFFGPPPEPTTLPAETPAVQSPQALLTIPLQFIMTDAKTGAIIHALEDVYYLEPGRKVVFTTSPELALEGTAIYGKITASKGALAYTAPNNPTGLDIITMQASGKESKKHVVQKTFIIQIF